MYGRLIKDEEHLINLRFVHHLTFEVEAKDIKEKLPEHCEISITKWSPNRNTNQNSLYWKIVGDIARLTMQPKSAVHNHLLNEYGVIQEKDGELVTVSMRSGYNYLEDDELHLKPTGKSFILAEEKYDIYYKLVNSHNMTSDQFSYLIKMAEEERNGLE